MWVARRVKKNHEERVPNFQARVDLIEMRSGKMME